MMKRIVFVMVLLCASPATARQLFDHVIPPGANFDKAEFRMWLPPDTPKVRAIRSARLFEYRGVVTSPQISASTAPASTEDNWR